VYVRFVSASCGSDGGGNGTVLKSNSVAAMSVLSKCVDAASKHAKANGGALQYMQGCGLMVSFNAASRVAAHESKACAFALSLKGAVEALQVPGADVVVHASIVTTNVLSFFAGDKGQLMLTVLGGFMTQHTAMHHYLAQTVGKEASCVLLSESMIQTIEMLYEHRLLGGVLVSTKTRQPDGTNGALTSMADKTFATHISELVGEQERQDDEWMYHASDASGVAVLGALEGNGGGMDVLSGVLSGSSNDIDWSSDTVLLRCVKERFEECVRTGDSFLGTTYDDGRSWYVDAVVQSPHTC
jgi:hypothetical protein